MDTAKNDYSARIRHIRDCYGISRKSLALLLGISEPSIVRYEQGQSPSKSNRRLLELAEEPAFMRTCFEEMGRFLPASQQRSMRERLIESDPSGASEMNGFTTRVPQRIAAAMNLIAEQCREPYFTRVIKGCFVADFMHFERYGTSLLGLSYAHAPHGPVIDGHALVRQNLEQAGLITLADDGWGLRFAPTESASSQSGTFDEQELAILREAAQFVDSFDSVRTLSDATHELDCWKSTLDGETIPYRRDGQVGALVEARLYEPNEELVARLNELSKNSDTSHSDISSSATTLDELFAEASR